MNIGEEICGSYLKYVKKCDFVDYNINTTSSGQQGEIDVIGIDQSHTKVYVCEVAVHLATGLQYTKDGSPNVKEKIQEKFTRDIAYVTQKFPGYNIFPMFWSPIVKNTTSNPAKDGLIAVRTELSKQYPNTKVASMELIINKEWSSKVDVLRKVAKGKSNELFGVMRVFQIEEWLNDYLSKHP